MTCPRCGAPAVAGAAFCTHCGAPLSGTAAAQPGSGGGTAVAAAHAPAGPERGLHFLALGGLGCLGLLLGFLLLLILLAQAQSFGVFVLSVLLAILPVPIYAALIVSLDRHVREPLWLLAAAFFWGAVVASVLAVFFNGIALGIFNALAGPNLALPLAASFVAPPVEETAKGLALLLIFLFFRAQLNDVADGIVLGALVGLGFAMTENIGYFARAFAQGGLVGAGINFFARVLFAGFLHPMCTAATGAGLGLAEETTNPRVRIAAPILGWFAAMFLHFLWNTVAGLLGAAAAASGSGAVLLVLLPFQTLVLLIPGVVTLLAITIFAWRRESSVLTTYLKDEVDRGVVLPGEYALLGDDRGRARRVWSTLFAHGPAGWYTLRRFYNEEACLAFRKWHTARGEQLPSYLSARSEDAHRRHIAQLRTQLQHIGVATD